MLQIGRLSAPQVVGALLVLYGIAVALRWFFQIEIIAQLIPGSARVGIINPLLFFSAGVCFLGASHWKDTSPWPHRAMTLCIVVLIAFPLAYLFETFTGIALGVDFVRQGTPVTPENPNPGRISPNASLAFLMIGTAFWVHSRAPTVALQRAYLAMIALIAIIGLGGLAGYLLGIEDLYQIASFNRMLPVTACGLSVVAAGLWLLYDESVVARGAAGVADIERRIGRRSWGVIALVALGGGLAGFAVLRDTFEQAIEQTMLVTATTTATSLANSIKAGLAFPRIVATRPTVRETVGKLKAVPGDAAATEYLQKIADSFLTAGLSGVEFYADDRLLSRAGTLRTPQAHIAQRLQNAGQIAHLVWHDGYFLATENEVQVDGQRVGRVLTEQRLGIFDRLLAEVRGLNESSDAVICERQGDTAICAPTRFRRERFEHPLSAAHAGGAGAPLARAFKGERGVMALRDGFGNKVISGFAPIGDYGLGFAVKTNVQTLYIPLQSRLNLLVVALLGLLGLGVYFQRCSVRPLIKLLVSSEARIKSILEDQSELVSLARPDGQLIYVNPAYARHFNTVPAALIGKSLLDLVEPADRATVQRLISSVIDGGASVTSENRMRAPSGDECWVSWTNSAQRDESGRPVLHSVGRDVTVRRSAELALKTSQAFLARTGRVAGVGGWEMQMATGVVIWSDETRRIHEVGPDFVPSLEAALTFYPPPARAMLEAAVEQAMGAGVPWDLEVPFVTARGHALWVRSQGEAEFEGHTPVRLVGAFQDITVRKSLEQELQRQSATLRSVTEAIPAMVAVVGLDRRFRFVNNAFERWIGARRSSIVGETLEQVLGQVDHQRSLPWVERTLAGETVSFERAYVGRQTASHLGLTYTPLWNGETVDGFVSVALDLSTHKREQGRLLQLAQRDPLTGLLNRAGFEQYLQAQLHDAKEASLALLYVDLDHFKPVNDTHGHPVGDQVLQIFADRLQAIVRPTDAVARLGGDEFAIALPGLRDSERAQVVADKVVSAGHAPFEVGPLVLHVSASVGIALGPPTLTGWQDLILRADAMLYRAKAAGRGQHASEA